MFLDYEEQDTYERSIIGFIQASTRRGLNPKLIEEENKLTIKFKYNGLDIEHITNKKEFVKTDKIELLNLLGKFKNILLKFKRLRQIINGCKGDNKAYYNNIIVRSLKGNLHNNSNNKEEGDKKWQIQQEVQYQ